MRKPRIKGLWMRPTVTSTFVVVVVPTTLVPMMV
jgi:hypothetical protein